MGKLIFGIFIILVSFFEVIRVFGHHFIPVVDGFGKEFLLWMTLIWGGIYLIYSAGKDHGKEFFSDEW